MRERWIVDLECGKIIELNEALHPVGRIDSAAARKIQIRGEAEIHESDRQWEIIRLTGRAARRDILETHIERETEIIVACQDRSEEVMEITVSFGGVPGDVEILIRRIPAKEICVTVNSPVVIGRL
ncbi:MAG: hypothetical protein JWM68_1824 [Verrucomicrobiales bacterium]|nr:hypothetical protein [Verrucomicrobiales bacterium]